MKKGFIYIIRNTINNKVYIGQTKVDVQTRWKEHLRHAKYGDQVINRAMRKHGVNKFYIETLEICDIDIIDDREMFYIKLYNSTDKSKGYNVSIGGATPRFKRKYLSIANLVDLYVNQQKTLEQIAQMYNVTRYIICTELRNAGVTIRKRSESSSRFNKISKDKIQKALKVTGSLRKAAKMIGVKYSTFRNACIYYHIEYNSSKSIRHQKQ